MLPVRARLVVVLYGLGEHREVFWHRIPAVGEAEVIHRATVEFYHQVALPDEPCMLPSRAFRREADKLANVSSLVGQRRAQIGSAVGLSGGVQLGDDLVTVVR